MFKVQFSLDSDALKTRVEEETKTYAQKFITDGIRHKVQDYFYKGNIQLGIKPGEGTAMIDNFVVNFLLNEKLQKKIEASIAHALEEKIASTVAQSVDYWAKKHAFRTVRELAEKDPQALIKFILDSKEV